MFCRAKNQIVPGKRHPYKSKRGRRILRHAHKHAKIFYLRISARIGSFYQSFSHNVVHVVFISGFCCRTIDSASENVADTPSRTGKTRRNLQKRKRKACKRRYSRKRSQNRLFAPYESRYTNAYKRHSRNGSDRRILLRRPGKTERVPRENMGRVRISARSCKRRFGYE